MKQTFTLMIALFFLCGFACSKSKKAENEHDHHAHHEKMSALEPSDSSIFNLSSTWKNQDAQKVNLQSLAGKIQVMALVYTSCEYACPRIVGDMLQIERGLSSSQKKEIGFVLASIDSKRDVPEKLKEFSKRHGFSNAWTLLHGSESDVRELAAVLGVQYKSISETDFTHSNLISILNQKGEIIHQQKGLGVDPTESLEKIKAVLSPSVK